MSLVVKLLLWIGIIGLFVILFCTNLPFAVELIWMEFFFGLPAIITLWRSEE